MSRPAKPVDVLSKHLTKEEYAVRKEQENRLKGNNDSIHPSSYLTEEQQIIFYNIVDHMKASEILSNIDVHLLSAYVVAVDRIQWIDSHINRDPNQMLNKEIMSARKQHMDDFKRLSTELGFSPQSRAKLGNINLQRQQDDGDPLLKVLSGGK